MPKTPDETTRIPRRNKNGRFSKSGHHYAIGGTLQLLPQYQPRPAPTPAPEPSRGEAPARPAPAPAEGGFTTRKGARYSTWFKAMGTSGKLKDLQGTESPDLLHEDLEEYAAPAAFYSNQSGLLGRVKYDGIRPLDDIIDDLNSRLQFAGEETAGFDFRQVYAQWSYRYQVIETLGPTDRVIQEISQRRP